MKLHVIDKAGLNEPGVTVSIMTSFVDEELPIKITMKEGTNDRFDFVQTIFEFVDLGYLVEGDILLVDNAAIHHANETWDMLIGKLESNKIKLFFLPKYSPELNPCELVHAQVKHFLRDHPPDLPLWAKIIQGVSRISVENVRNFYRHCYHFG